MNMIACTCDNLPAHDHFMGQELKDGVWRPRWDLNDIGRIWVDWKQVARGLLNDGSES